MDEGPISDRSKGWHPVRGEQFGQSRPPTELTPLLD